jgi:hypothetical protein
MQIEGSNGFLPVVLQILASEESELGARQAGECFVCLNPWPGQGLCRCWLECAFSFADRFVAAIYFKNRLGQAWDTSKNPANPISVEDKNIVKQSILQALVTTPNAVK